MRKNRILIIFIMFIFILTMTSCASDKDKHKYTGIDLASKKPLPMAPFTKYIYLYDGLYFISGEAMDDSVFKGRVGKKIGNVGVVSHRLVNEGDVAVTDPNQEEIKEGDPIMKITDIKKETAILIKTEKGYYYAQVMTREKIK